MNRVEEIVKLTHVAAITLIKTGATIFNICEITR